MSCSPIRGAPYPEDTCWGPLPGEDSLCPLSDCLAQKGPGCPCSQRLESLAYAPGTDELYLLIRFVLLAAFSGFIVCRLYSFSIHFAPLFSCI